MASAFKRVLPVIALLALFLLVATVAGGAWVWQKQQSFVDEPLAGLQENGTIEVASGDSFASVLRKLRAAGVEDGHDLQWRWLARELDAAGNLKVGEFALEPGTTPRDLLVRMRDGKIIQYRFTLIEGWNIRQLRRALDSANPLRHEGSELDDAALMKALGLEGVHPEGRFLPDTYLYSRSDSDLDILRRAHAAMEKALAEAWGARDPDAPLKSAEEALILASIIEKETGVADERPQIAGVFARRLRKGWLLQTDPTVIYGLGSAYDGNIRKRDLLTDTPYNTYTRKGLTPTPIAMPSREALQAAVNPAPGEAMYFVALGDGTRGHAFSATYAEHQAAVTRYWQRRRQQDAAARESQP